MIKLLTKILGFILMLVLIIPMVSLFLFLSVCGNYFYSILISAFTLYLFIGFTGVACFLTIALAIVLHQIGSYFNKKGLEFIYTSMENKLNKLSDDEKAQTNRGFKINDILGKIGGL